MTIKVVDDVVNDLAIEAVNEVLNELTIEVDVEVVNELTIEVVKVGDKCTKGVIAIVDE